MTKTKIILMMTVLFLPLFTWQQTVFLANSKEQTPQASSTPTQSRRLNRKLVFSKEERAKRRLERFKIAREILKKAKVPFNPDELLARRWRTRLASTLTNMKEMKSPRHETMLKQAIIADTLYLPEKVQLKEDTVIIANNIVHEGQNVLIKGNRNIYIYAKRHGVLGTTLNKLRERQGPTFENISFKKTASGQFLPASLPTLKSGTITIDTSGKGRPGRKYKLTKFQKKGGVAFNYLPENPYSLSLENFKVSYSNVSISTNSLFEEEGDQDTSGEAGEDGEPGEAGTAGNSGEAGSNGDKGLCKTTTSGSDTPDPNGKDGGDGGAGQLGGNGEVGGNGGDGTDAGNIDLEIDECGKPTDPQEPTSVTYYLLAIGGDGGKGGAGGDGGSGGSGGAGGNGGDGAGCSCCDGVGNGGKGGVGGNGGKGGIGGKGGNGGKGGKGGYIDAHGYTWREINIEYSVDGGYGGEAGEGGSAGSGGSAGRAGTGGKGATMSGEDCPSKGVNGEAGTAGNKGEEGNKGIIGFEGDGGIDAEFYVDIDQCEG